MSHTFFHISREAMQPGDRIEPGGLGARIKALQARPVETLSVFDRRLCETEARFETYRAAHHADRPSRLNCCYALPGLDELPALLALIPDLRGCAVYQVRPADSAARIYNADFGLRNRLLPGRRRHPGSADPLDAAVRSYWRAPARRMIECLIESALIVEEKIADSAADLAAVPRAAGLIRRVTSRLADPIATVSPPTGSPPMTDCFPDTMLPAIFADGLAEVTISAGVARITLYRHGRNNNKQNCAELLIPAVMLAGFANQVNSIAEQLAEAQKRAATGDRI